MNIRKFIKKYMILNMSTPTVEFYDYKRAYQKAHDT